MNSALKTTEEKEQARWFAMRVYKNEQTAEERLKGKDGLEHFIPKHYVIRTYHGVKSKRLAPVIPSLVFVHATHKQIIEFKKTYNLLQFIIFGKNDKATYLVVPDKQMNDFIQIASHYEENLTYLKPEEVNLEKGTRVRIHGSKFDGVEGVFMRIQGKRNRRLVIMLDGIMGISVEVHPDLIEVIS